MNTRTQRKQFSKSMLLGAATVCSLALGSAANAAFVLTLEDITAPGSATVIYDGAGNDFSGVDGVIVYSGIVGNFNVNVTTGVSAPVIGPGRLDLNSINVSSGSGGTLVVRLSDTDFSGPAYPSYQAAYGGTTDGSVDFSFLYDAANTEFGGASFATGSFTASPGSNAFADDILGSILPTAPYSLSIVATITHGAGNLATSFNAGAAPIPLPAAAYLLGSALLGLGFARHRRT